VQPNRPCKPRWNKPRSEGGGSFWHSAARRGSPATSCRDCRCGHALQPASGAHQIRPENRFPAGSVLLCNGAPQRGDLPEETRRTMSKLDFILEELVTANRVLANEGIVDSFGHVSARHPDRPDHYLMSRARAPERIEKDDIVEYTLDGTA